MGEQNGKQFPARWSHPPERERAGGAEKLKVAAVMTRTTMGDLIQQLIRDELDKILRRREVTPNVEVRASVAGPNRPPC